MKHDPWMRLAASVRSARPEDREPPFGFTTRVLARVRAAGADQGIFWEALLRRAALCSALAVLLAAGVLAIASNSSLDDDPTDFELVMDQDLNP